MTPLLYYGFLQTVEVEKPQQKKTKDFNSVVNATTGGHSVFSIAGLSAPLSFL